MERANANLDRLLGARVEGACVDSMQEAQPSRTIESLAIGTRARVAALPFTAG